MNLYSQSFYNTFPSQNINRYANFLLLTSADSDPRGQSQEGIQDPITLSEQANQ